MARTASEPRGRLTRDGVVAAAIRIADLEGLQGVSMRRIAAELGADPMSLYRHVDGKEGLLEAMADAVVAGIRPVADGEGWRSAARGTMMNARSAMLAHPWTAALLTTRSAPSPAAMRYLDTFFSILRDGGLSVELLHHAVHVLGSRILGFSQDLYDDAASGTASDTELPPALAAAYPRLAELAVAVSHDGGLGGCDVDDEFAFALDLILDGLERHLADRGTTGPVPH